MKAYWAPVLCALALNACAAEPVRIVSPLRDIQDFAPAIHLDMRYAGSNNFTGRIVEGYQAPKCLLHEPVARALARVEHGLRAQGFALIVYDCYRPTTAVQAFMAWARDLTDQSSKARFYPALDKSVLVPDYIAEKSGHSKAATVDLGLLDCRQAACSAVDMGTEFDFFDLSANTDYPGITPLQRQNRQKLLQAMAEQGFENYPMEWWHFTWKAGKLPDTAMDFPVQ